MINAQAQKFVQAVRPGAIVDDAAFTGQVIDTAGYRYATIAVQLGATDIAMAALKMTECDTSGGSYTDITGAAFGATDAPALPTATDDNGIFLFHINLAAGRKRYLKLAATAGNGSTGTYLSAICMLSRAEQFPETDTERGVVASLTV